MLKTSYFLDGNWGDWSDSSDCTATCGTATKEQVRQCNNPPESHGGQPCQGDATQTVDCLFIDCPLGKIHIICYDIYTNNRKMYYLTDNYSIL